MADGATTDRFEFERVLVGRGCGAVAGVDEVGRGPLAGPVVAAAVILPVSWIADGMPEALRGLNDSKQLSAAVRERFYGLLMSLPEVRHAVAEVDVATIDAINILQATHRAMKEALAALTPGPEHVLVDGLAVPTLRWPQTPLVKGDARSYSIAAASVLAKVTRDRQMAEYDRQFPGYGFGEHKGYGTAKHLAALARLGPTPIHRRSFAPLRRPDPELF